MDVDIVRQPSQRGEELTPKRLMPPFGQRLLRQVLQEERILADAARRIAFDPAEFGLVQLVLAQNQAQA